MSFAPCAAALAAGLAVRTISAGRDSMVEDKIYAILRATIRTALDGARPGNNRE